MQLNLYQNLLVKPNFKEFRVDGRTRSNIKTGSMVKIVLKQDQRSGRLTKGEVKDILTNSPKHPHGIKVRLMDGQVGRVKEICDC
jgi:uncharacterized repeat protein (TIGR03833 family)